MLISNIILVVTALLTSGSAQSCAKINTRKEWRELTTFEQQDYFRGVNLLKKAPSTSNNANRYEDFVATHLQNVPFAHNIAYFFPWHRQFLRSFELALQQVLKKPDYTLPYWQWTIDSQAPERSPLLTPTAFGTNGQGVEKCLLDGAFRNWTTTQGSSRPRCLKRDFNLGSRIGAFASPEVINSAVMTSRDYVQFRPTIEANPHGQVHNGLGGRSGDMSFMFSPNDPIFFLHHAMVDRIWYEFQNAKPANKLSFGGPSKNDGTGTAKLTDNMIPFNVNVQSVMDTRFGCYIYSAGVTVQPRSFKRKVRRATEVNPLSVKSDDRSEIQLIRVPAPLDIEYITRMGLNLTEVRLSEAKEKLIIEDVNKLIMAKEYQSPAALGALQTGELVQAPSFDDVTPGFTAKEQ
ncbi:hypothetical protein HDU92_000516 [Lobulomyces angularis]|nr:hypothetical protein HDU92_000516 [Lobulomyces angularis]